MTLPVASNPIALSQVNTELGLSSTAQISLNDAAVRSLAGVPSGAIRLPADFWGKSALTFAVSTAPVTDSNVGSPSFAATVYKTNGDIDAAVIIGSTKVGQWITPSTGAPGGYYIRADVTSGSIDGSSSATGVDLALSSARSWSVTQTVAGTKTATLTITIKDGPGGNVLATGSITITAQVS